jgi:2-desacetyl-2-hydroxyethyl bacteriochlorophyllide A dehydrogenase
MPNWLVTILGAIYSRIPAALRPPLRRAFLWLLLRIEALLGRRKVERGQRVEFLDFEIAHLEPFEFLGAGRNDVLVRAAASGVSPGTERAVLCGLPGARRPFPYTPGYSTAGEVVRAGKASGFKPGDRVAGKMSHASHGVMTPASLFKVPDGVRDEEAAFIELGIICLQGVRKAGIRPGERVAIVGQGLIGQLAMRLARIAGAEPIIAVAASGRRRETALRHGAADSFVALSDDPAGIDGIGADVVIEAVGSAPAIGLAMRAARPGGRVILLGSSRDLGRGLDWFSMAQSRDVSLVGAHIGVMPRHDRTPTFWTYADEGKLFLDMLARGVLSMSDMITWRAAPGDCNEVYEVLAGGGRDHVGIVFDWAALRPSA